MELIDFGNSVSWSLDVTAERKDLLSFKIASAPGLHTRFSRPWWCPLFSFKTFFFFWSNIYNKIYRLDLS